MTDTFVADMVRDLLDAGFTRGQIGRNVGVSTSAVCRWLNGTRCASGYSAFRLARLHRALTGKAA